MMERSCSKAGTPKNKASVPSDETNSPKTKGEDVHNISTSIDGFAVAEALSKLIERGAFRDNRNESIGKRGEKLINKLEAAIAEAANLEIGSFILNPNRRNSKRCDKAFFIGLPKRHSSSDLDWTQRVVFGTECLFLQAIRYMQGVCYKTGCEAVAIVSDWDAKDSIRWKDNIEHISLDKRISFFLAHGGKASQLRFESMEEESMNGGRKRKLAGKYMKVARALTKILDDWESDYELSENDVKGMISASSGLPSEAFSVYPYEDEPKELAVFLSLSNWCHAAPWYESKHFSAGFGDALETIVAHVQGIGRNITKEAVLITDCWDSEEFDFWKHNLKAISEEAKIEIYLYVAREPNLIEI